MFVPALQNVLYKIHFKYKYKVNDCIGLSKNTIYENSAKLMSNTFDHVFYNITLENLSLIVNNHLEPDFLEAASKTGLTSSQSNFCSQISETSDSMKNVEFHYRHYYWFQLTTYQAKGYLLSPI